MSDYPPALDAIPGIAVMATARSLLITAADEYRLLVARRERPHAVDSPRVRWEFDEGLSDKPRRAAHFDLRRQIHEVLNGA